MAEWTSEIEEELKKLYVETDIPSDTLIKSKENLSRFTSTLNSKLTDHDGFTQEEVAGKLLKIRKTGNLPTIRS
ncbi:MAG: hypothetical protein FVQ80_04035 [Planctomycetes bacterium]|nr:hypothetical protein [Planctomycetota bacterium]